MGSNMSDGAMYSDGPSVEHLTRLHNAAMGKIGMERKEHLLHVIAGTKAFLARAKTNQLIGTEAVELAQGLLAQAQGDLKTCGNNPGPEEDED